MSASPWDRTTATARYVDEAEPLVGWRVWAVRPDGAFESPLVRPAAPGRALLTSFGHGVPPPPAECVLVGPSYLLFGHDAPDPDCACGYHVVRDLPDLASMLLRLASRPDCRPLALAEVRAWGRVAGPDLHWRSRRAGALARASRVSIGDVIELSPDASPLAEAVERAFPACHVRSSSGPHREWLRSIRDRNRSVRAEPR